MEPVNVAILALLAIFYIPVTAFCAAFAYAIGQMIYTASVGFSEVINADRWPVHADGTNKFFRDMSAAEQARVMAAARARYRKLQAV